MGVEGFLISSALIGVLSQRLVRRICVVCKGSGTDEIEVKPCRNCGGKGYRDRVGIFELLGMQDNIRKAINRGADSTEIGNIARENGMIPLRDDGNTKVANGVTTAAEIGRVCQLDR